MARKSKSTTNKRTYDNNIAWINIPIEDEVYDAVLENPPQSDHITDFILDSLRQGYGFSLKFNPKADAFVASLVGVAGDPDTAFGVSSFADTAEDALLGLYVKAVVVADFNFGQYANGTGKSSRRFR